jgi:hypothetical protein
MAIGFEHEFDTVRVVWRGDSQPAGFAEWDFRRCRATRTWPAGWRGSRRLRPPRVWR